MPQTDLTTDEVLDSLTGHEELWIADQFGRPIGEFITNPSMYRRVLIFVLKRREKVNENDARAAAMDMQIKDVLKFFATEDDDESPGDVDADVEPGKAHVASESADASADEPLRMISPASAS